MVFLAAIWWMRRTQFGASLVAIREDEIGAEMRGINTTVTKASIFVVSGFVTGLVGGLWAYQNTFISPTIVFEEETTVGRGDDVDARRSGHGRRSGDRRGGHLRLRDVVWANFLDYHLIVQGSVLILVVLFFPEGIVGRLSRRSGAVSIAHLFRTKASPEPGAAAPAGEEP